MDRSLRVLMITSEWPDEKRPFAVPFLVQQVEFLRRAGVTVEIFHFRGAKNPFNYLKAWWRLQKKHRLASSDFDLVHAQFGQSALLPWPRRIPLVITFHGTDILGHLSPAGDLTLQGRLLVFLGRNAARFADAVVIVSNAMRRNLRISRPLHVLPTGVDLAALPELTREEARLQLGLPLDEKLALFVGDPNNPLKRYAHAQAAVHRLNETSPVRLIVGWGRPHSEIITLMQACDALVVTSRQEGSPTIVKEALACNLPIVSVVVGDVAERLNGVRGCEIVPDNQPATVAAALGRVLANGARIKGREAVANLDEKLLAERLIGIYGSVVRNRRTSSRLTGRRVAADENG